MQDTSTNLLQILSNEIARDGGASLVVCLKEYVEFPKQIDSLLTKSIGSKKLLTFLERYPTIFQVDRESIPHFVKLLSDEYCCRPEEENGEGPDGAGNTVGEGAPGDATRQHAAHHALREKVAYVLRRRASKMVRRQQSNDRQEVSLDWLTKECAMLLHFYLRACGYYRKIYSSSEDVHIVSSPSWYELVIPEFEAFLKEGGEAFVFDSEVGKVGLRQDVLQIDIDEESLQRFSIKLQQVVKEDGGTHSRLSLLLHRNPDLKALLGGRDFLLCVELNPTLFSEFIIERNETDVDLRSTTKQHDDGRMDVDETGLFSVASSKWGTAMANIMIGACSACTSLLESDPTKITAIDLTASVGGFTLALAKTRFSRVIAVEIDPHRAELCRQNMITHGVEEVVDVRNADAMNVLHDLAEEVLSTSQPQSVVILDPPWGGIHYKREKKPIFMGPWALDEVICKVALHLAPTIIGVRVPVNFEVRSFLGNLVRDHALNFNTLNIRKLGPQLFVVLEVCKQESTN
jgi:hypothetical protein